VIDRAHQALLLDVQMRAHQALLLDVQMRAYQALLLDVQMRMLNVFFEAGAICGAVTEEHSAYKFIDVVENRAEK
jgi:hypothetical protein